MLVIRLHNRVAPPSKESVTIMDQELSYVAALQTKFKSAALKYRTSVTLSFLQF